MSRGEGANEKHIRREVDVGGGEGVCGPAASHRYQFPLFFRHHGVGFVEAESLEQDLNRALQGGQPVRLIAQSADDMGVLVALVGGGTPQV